VTAKILAERRGWLAVDKPAGALVIPGRGEEEGPSLREELEGELRRKVFVVHRLDRDTSGVLLFALDAPVHRTLSMAFEAGRIEKRYLALVQGRLSQSLELNGALVPARRGRMRVARAGEEGRQAHTLVRPVEQFAEATLVEAVPLTGRTHQIRVHLAHAGYPLLFDHQYGSKDPSLIARTPLHAGKVVIPALDGIEAETIESPLPDDIAQALARLRGVLP
jgi:RluA family pseudouridine synthase